MLIGEFRPETLIVDTRISPVTSSVRLKKGQGTLLRGTVLGKITDTGLCVPVDSSSIDGSERPLYILTDDKDTDRAEDVSALVYTSGIFDSDCLIFGGTDILATHKKAMRNYGLHVE